MMGNDYMSTMASMGMGAAAQPQFQQAQPVQQIQPEVQQQPAVAAVQPQIQQPQPMQPIQQPQQQNFADIIARMQGQQQGQPLQQQNFQQQGQQQQAQQAQQQNQYQDQIQQMRQQKQQNMNMSPEQQRLQWLGTPINQGRQMEAANPLNNQQQPRSMDMFTQGPESLRNQGQSAINPQQRQGFQNIMGGNQGAAPRMMPPGPQRNQAVERMAKQQAIQSGQVMQNDPRLNSMQQRQAMANQQMQAMQGGVMEQILQQRMGGSQRADPNAATEMNKRQQAEMLRTRFGLQQGGKPQRFMGDPRMSPPAGINRGGFDGMASPKGQPFAGDPRMSPPAGMRDPRFTRGAGRPGNPRDIMSLLQNRLGGGGFNPQMPMTQQNQNALRNIWGQQ